MEEIKVNAIMLRGVDYLENDKILTLYTAERGKITAGIKGVKKAGAKLKFAAQPCCFAEYVLAVRGGRYTVIQASENESFYELRCDIGKYYAACAVCEVLLALTEEGDSDKDLFSSSVKALSDICTGDESLALTAFLLGALKDCGYGINAGDCADCGASLVNCGKLRFDMDAAAFTCWGCGTGVGVSGSTYNRIRKAAGLRCDEGLAEDGKKRALNLLREYASYKTEARLSSLEEYIKLI